MNNCDKWKSNTPDQVGPGSYYSSETRPSIHSSAPFGSCEPRMSNQSGSNSPGFYSGHKSWGNKHRCSSAFGSRAVRLADIKPNTPGPGSYNLSFTHTRTIIPERTAQNPCNVFRTAVSIPSRDIPPTEVGPGSYNPQFQEGKNKGTSFGASLSKRDVFNENFEVVIGPGQYSIVDKEKSKSTWMFNSGCKRPFNEKEKVEGPGPGSYTVESHARTKVFSAGFGSNTKRDIKMTNDPHRPFIAHNTTTPPVGTYLSKDEQDKIEKLKKKLISNDYPVEKAPFGTSDKRNFEFSSDIPGPGYYQPKPSQQNQSVFVPKSPRFMQKFSVTPGPGTYSPTNAQSKKTQKFTSHGPRFHKPDEKPSQAHLSYSKHRPWTVKQTRYPDAMLIEKNLSFDTTSQRFVIERSYVPGPGQYEIRSQSAPKKAGMS